MFEGGKETWRDEKYKTEADESDNGLYDRFVSPKSHFPQLPPSGRIFPEFVTAQVTERSGILSLSKGRSAVTERSLSGH